MNDRSHRWTACLGLLLAASILAGPMTLASEEDAVEQGSAAPAGKAEAGKAEAAKAETAKTGSDEASDAQAATATAKEGEVPHPEFNTIEDLVAFRGPASMLWQRREAPLPVVAWRAVPAGDDAGRR